jgi:hypothetical protein
MTELTEHEAATLARFDAAADADESAVEKVARAIADSLDGGPFSDREWRQAFDEDVRAMYRDTARAAIDAMRPTPDAPQADTALRESVESLAQQYRAVADASFNTFSADVYDEVAQDLRTALDTAS